MRRKLLVLPVLFAGLVGLSHGQPPGGFGGGEGRRGMFGGQPGQPPDPEMMWGWMSKGQPTINLNDPANSRMRDRMQRDGTPLPPDGILTKDQFKANFQASMARRQAGGGAPGATPPAAVPGAAPTPGFQGGPPGGGRNGYDPSGMTDEQVRSFMQPYDSDGDGRVSLAEVGQTGTPGMKERFTEFDTNRDGYWDTSEYRAYNVARYQQRMGGAIQQAPPPTIPVPGGPVPPGTPPAPGQPSAEEERPEVLRFGKLPKGAPSWMLAPSSTNRDGLDADRDGQVGLYEWRRAGRRTAEFVEKDLNADGFLTYTEWKTFNERQAEKQKAEDPDAAPTPPPAPAASPGGDRREKGDRPDRPNRGEGKGERKGPRNPFSNKR